MQDQLIAINNLISGFNRESTDITQFCTDIGTQVNVIYGTYFGSCVRDLNVLRDNNFCLSVLITHDINRISPNNDNATERTRISNNICRIINCNQNFSDAESALFSTFIITFSNTFICPPEEHLRKLCVLLSRAISLLENADYRPNCVILPVYSYFHSLNQSEYESLNQVLSR